MTKQEASQAYVAYAELENAAEAFYAAVIKINKLFPEKAERLGTICEEINFVVCDVDAELDEVL